MSLSSRLVTVAGAAVLAVGLAACGGEADPAGPDSSTSYPVEEPSDVGDDHGPSDLDALVGDWELVPTEPHTKTPLTVTEEGTAEVPASDGALATRGFAGTVDPDGAGGFTVTLVSTDADLEEWVLTLKPGAMAETFDVTDAKGSTYTLVRA
ncbi:hypothetical protein [Phytomonospora endophytica]|uniref:Lipocalin-like domain-containing protein n=1 Tax=Phytomonospora endophytica TaxID=714109 RepID=A0A841FYH2_9ACTN|nr:hypothetical protein [Phytomonospora endophytica]MBB6039793.1 hypothetical protein [Phytomonospora endophytica]GIG70353.1 hypothetical protein Pen01_66480 [Phytomonospora endophytica]